MLQLQNAILEMVARGEPLPAVAEHLCRKVEALAPGTVCSILEVDAAGALHPIAAPSLSEHYSAAIDGTTMGPNVGSCGTAAYLGEAVTVEDIERDPRWKDFAALALPLGLRACWSSPIKDGQNAVIGTFAFYYRECRGPNAVEQQLVRACVHLCSIAISHHRWESEQKRRAFQDSLTGLPNRSAFNEAISRLPCDRTAGWALLVVDLDNLKIVNDTFGHHVGDALIVTAGRRIARAVAPDKAYRLGGDEFAVLVRTPAMLANLEGLATSVLATLSEPADCAGHTVVPRATMGGAVLSGSDGQAERVRQKADFALYHAKETSRGSFVCYWDEIGSRITRRLEAITNVHEALREERLLAHYQPVYRLDTQELAGFEALCRIRVGEHLLPAEQFWEATADMSVATALAERMLIRVATDMHAWREFGLDAGHVSINVCAADFHSGQLPSQISSIFGAVGVGVDGLVIEVSEAVAAGRAQRDISSQLEALRMLGIRTALDNFGRASASLSHLVTAPIDIVKMDKGLVGRLGDDPRTRAVVEAILHIARASHITVIAEGVESVGQASLLAAAGCKLAQGYFLAPPMDAAAATELLHAQNLRQSRQKPHS